MRYRTTCTRNSLHPPYASSVRHRPATALCERWALSPFTTALALNVLSYKDVAIKLMIRAGDPGSRTHEVYRMLMGAHTYARYSVMDITPGSERAMAAESACCGLAGAPLLQCNSLELGNLSP